MKKNVLFQNFFFGIVNGISISFIYLVPFTIISYYFFFKNIFDQKNKKKVFFLGWSFGAGFFLSSMHWIISPFLVFEKHYILAPFVLFIFPFMMGLFFSIPSLLTSYCLKFVKLFHNKF